MKVGVEVTGGWLPASW